MVNGTTLSSLGPDFSSLFFRLAYRTVRFVASAILRLAWENVMAVRPGRLIAMRYRQCRRAPGGSQQGRVLPAAEAKQLFSKRRQPRRCCIVLLPFARIAGKGITLGVIQF